MFERGGVASETLRSADSYKEVHVRQTQRATPMAMDRNVEIETGRESVEVAEAIKALQAQLADLRRIVQAAKLPTAAPVKPARSQ